MKVLRKMDETGMDEKKESETSFGFYSMELKNGFVSEIDIRKLFQKRFLTSTHSRTTHLNLFFHVSRIQAYSTLSIFMIILHVASHRKRGKLGKAILFLLLLDPFPSFRGISSRFCLESVLRFPGYHKRGGGGNVIQFFDRCC